MDSFVIPDAHGNSKLVLGLLEQEGIIGQAAGIPGVSRLKPRWETEVIQLGDLANCVLESIYQDCEAIAIVQKGLIDVMLVGNHEHPYFGGPKFNGFVPDPAVRVALNGIARIDALRAAHAVGNIVLTHAGIPTWVMRDLKVTTAGEAARKLNDTWARDPTNPFFSSIGQARGGWGVNGGGILWSDWKEKKPRGLRQIFGHTVGEKVRSRGTIMCLDLGAGKRSRKIAGAWIRDGEIDVVTYESEEPVWEC